MKKSCLMSILTVAHTAVLHGQGPVFIARMETKNQGIGDCIMQVCSAITPYAAAVYIMAQAIKKFFCNAKNQKSIAPQPLSNPTQNLQHEQYEITLHKQVISQMHHQESYLKTIHQQYSDGTNTMPEPHITERCYALHNALQQPNYDYKHYTLSDDAQQLISSNHYTIDNYTICYGNQLQHSLHHEITTIINKIGSICSKNRLLSTTPLTTLLIDMVENTRLCLEHGLFSKAITLVDACWAFLNGITIIAEDITIALPNNRSLYSFAHHIATIAAEIAGIIFTPRAQEHSTDCWKTMANTLYTTYYDIKNYVASSTREKLKDKTAFTPEILIAQKVSMALEKFYRRTSILAHIISKNNKNPAWLMLLPEYSAIVVANNAQNIYLTVHKNCTNNLTL